MRYIRTKNNKIIDLDKETFDAALPRENFVKFNAIKQADTIEELSDELVVKYKNEEKPRCIDMSELLKTCKDIAGNVSFVAFRKHIKWLFTSYKNQLEICKLAIWTDEGLIYIAAMNEEGAPCLL